MFEKGVLFLSLGGEIAVLLCPLIVTWYLVRTLCK